jgi:hypothetical protein
MTQKKKTQSPPKPFISRSPDFRTIYATGAFGQVSPFDYRLAFYTHETQFPKEPEATTAVKVSQVFHVEVIMSYDMMKRLKDMLDQQLKQREKTQESKEKGE